MSKRIFCNFYGCGQKRSGRDEQENDALAEEDSDAAAFNRNFLVESLPRALERMAAQNSDLKDERYLRAVLFEALKDRMSDSGHPTKKRNV